MIPADSMATSVPAPMAIPTSACAKAGASFTPSPTMATFSPCSCSAATSECLSSGSTSERTSIDAEIPSYCLGHLVGVSGDHRHLQADGVQLVDGLTGLGADLVLERKCPDHRVLGESRTGRPLRLIPNCDLLSDSGRDRGLRLAKQGGTPDRESRAVDGGFDAPAAHGLECPRSRNLTPAGRRRHDRPGKRMFGIGLDCRRRPQNASLSPSTAGDPCEA